MVLHSVPVLNQMAAGLDPHFSKIATNKPATTPYARNLLPCNDVSFPFARFVVLCAYLLVPTYKAKRIACLGTDKR